ncbi:hypothetical protein NLI96_g1893 [Meripilus lineatus]|uniref:F-box domain-containing protein n=1 Tax=Meripilus lineatus TaxID=2056292 RepID=A0AAD5VB66_9APHY|nr:hypothetical protein NLI96_g1893 [Physisporinus lineatus]
MYPFKEVAQLLSPHASRIRQLYVSCKSDGISQFFSTLTPDLPNLLDLYIGIRHEIDETLLPMAIIVPGPDSLKVPRLRRLRVVGGVFKWQMPPLKSLREFEVGFTTPFDENDRVYTFRQFLRMLRSCRGLKKLDSRQYFGEPLLPGIQYGSIVPLVNLDSISLTTSWMETMAALLSHLYLPRCRQVTIRGAVIAQGTTGGQNLWIFPANFMEILPRFNDGFDTVTIDWWGSENMNLVVSNSDPKSPSRSFAIEGATTFLAPDFTTVPLTISAFLRRWPITRLELRRDVFPIDLDCWEKVLRRLPSLRSLDIIMDPRYSTASTCSSLINLFTALCSVVEGEVVCPNLVSISFKAYTTVVNEVLGSLLDCWGRRKGQGYVSTELRIEEKAIFERTEGKECADYVVTLEEEGCVFVLDVEFAQ